MSHFQPVALEHASRLINHGPTVLVTTRSADGTRRASGTHRIRRMQGIGDARPGGMGPRADECRHGTIGRQLARQHHGGRARLRELPPVLAAGTEADRAGRGGGERCDAIDRLRRVACMLEPDADRHLAERHRHACAPLARLAVRASGLPAPPGPWP
jgi:hypothetical protein